MKFKGFFKFQNGVDHLIKLVNEAEPFIGEHEGARLERPLPRDRRPLNVGRQTDGRRSLARREDGAGGDLLHVLEKLRLGRSRVTADQNIQITF